MQLVKMTDCEQGKHGRFVDQWDTGTLTLATHKVICLLASCVTD